MHKRIHELALEAGGSHYPDVGGKTLEKFAELIVRECASIVYKTDTDHADGLALLLLHTFGVEE